MDLKRVKPSPLPETQWLPGQSKGLVIGKTLEKDRQGPSATVCWGGGGGGGGEAGAGEPVPRTHAACLMLGTALVDLTVGL